MAGKGMMAVQSANQTTEAIIGTAIGVHKHCDRDSLNLLTKNVCVMTLNLRNIPFQRQVLLPVMYKDVNLDCGYRIDWLVKNEVVVELRAMECMQPIHGAPRLCGKKLKERLWQRKYSFLD